MEKTPVSGPPTSVLPQCPTPSTYASTAPFPLPLPFPTHLCLFFHAGLLTRRATGRPRPPSPSMWRALWLLFTLYLLSRLPVPAPPFPAAYTGAPAGDARQSSARRTGPDAAGAHRSPRPKTNKSLRAGGTEGPAQWRQSGTQTARGRAPSERARWTRETGTSSATPYYVRAPAEGGKGAPPPRLVPRPSPTSVAPPASLPGLPL